MPDSLLGSATRFADAMTCVVVSYAPTIRSTISGGPPLDLPSYETDSLTADGRMTLEERDPCFEAIDAGWGQALAKAFADLPEPPLDA